jgi:signal peptidase I
VSDNPTTPAAAPAPEPPLLRFVRANRAYAALVVLALFEILPVAGLVISLRAGPRLWTPIALVFMAAAALPAAGVWLGKPWAYTLSIALCWAQLVATVVRGMAEGFTPVHVGVAVLFAAVLVALNSSRPRLEAPAAAPAGERRPDTFGLWLRENAEAIVVAFIMALVIRCFCIEVFKIPSSSMEPTLLGDFTNEHRNSGCDFLSHHKYSGGDRIMVTKYYYAASSVERFDVVVFKFPLNQSRNFIKRVVGLPDEWLLIHRGNLYVRPGKDPAPEAAKFQIARRTLRTQDSMWIRVGPPGGFLASAEEFFKSWDAGEAGNRLTLSAGELGTEERDNRRSARFEYRIGEHPIAQDGDPVGELHLAFDFELTGPGGEVFSEIVNEYGRFEARLSAAGENELRYHEPGAEDRTPSQRVPLKGVRLAMDRATRLALSVYDGLAVVRVDGRVAGEYPFIKARENVLVNESPRRAVAFGSRDVTFKVRRLELGRDIYYRGRPERHHGLREDTPFYIRPGHYMMMGDNVQNSHDSRAWTKRTFVLKDRKDPVVCEGQEVGNEKPTSAEDLMKKYDLRKRPDLVIAADEYGNAWALYHDDPGDLKPGGYAAVTTQELDAEPFREIDEKFVVGKALWIWWPPGRWFKLIR